MGEGSGGLQEGGKSNKERQCGECKHAYMPAVDDQQEYQRDHRGELRTHEAPHDASQEIGARGQSGGIRVKLNVRSPDEGRTQEVLRNRITPDLSEHSGRVMRHTPTDQMAERRTTSIRT